MTVTYSAAAKTNRLVNINDAINSKTYVVGSGGQTKEDQILFSMKDL